MSRLWKRLLNWFTTQHLLSNLVEKQDELIRAQDASIRSLNESLGYLYNRAQEIDRDRTLDLAILLSAAGGSVRVGGDLVAAIVNFKGEVDIDIQREEGGLRFSVSMTPAKEVQN